MRNLVPIGLFLVLFGMLVAPVRVEAGPAVHAHIDKRTQTMRVKVNGRHAYTWKVSTGAYSYHTPSGTYSAKRMHTLWRSRKYQNAPMPHAIFFKGGYAVHATGSISRLGRPASHGCIRLHPANAKKLFNLVKKHGMRNTRISLSGSYRFNASDRKYGKALRWSDANPRAAARARAKRRAAYKKRNRGTRRARSTSNRRVRVANRKNNFTSGLSRN
ncbi:MAG: L,D-transpeptidase [Hyphomicrobiales bacterium]